VRHKEPHLDAAGALADLLVFTLNLTGLDILAKIESQDTAWSVQSWHIKSRNTGVYKGLTACACFRWEYRLLFKARELSSSTHTCMLLCMKSNCDY